MADPRLIKKYPNRRLYDTERSCYITIEDVRKLVVDGVEFKVVDETSGDDITRSVLIQIITEQESGDEGTFTTEMLSRFIRLSHDTAQQAFSSYLDQSMKMFLEQQRAVGDAMYQALGGKTLAEMAQRNMELWRTMQENFMKTSGVAPKKDPSDTGGSSK